MKKISLLSVSLLGIALLCGGCGETSSSSEPNHQEMQYQIYEKAVEEGIFTGTYEEWLASIKGQDGTNGKDGVGIKSIVLTSSEGETDTYTITYTDGTTSTFAITNGKDGKDGSKGDKGEPGADGKDGTNGKDSPHFGETHVVTFAIEEGEYLPKDTASTITVNYGDVIVLPVPLKPGYVFKGWFTGESVNDGQWLNHTAVFDDITLKARWEKEVYTLPSTVKVVTGAKETYYYEDRVTVEPVLAEGKTFAGYKLNVNSFNDASVSWNKISSYAKTYQFEYVFGKMSDLIVETIDTPESGDGSEGTYIGTYIENGEENEITITLDGKGMYTFNGDLSAMELIGTSACWTPGTYEDLYFAPYLIDGSEVCFSNASIHLDETMSDGNTYSYIEAMDDHEEKTWRFWLDGNAYEEPKEVDFAGTYSNGELIININLDGTGSISGGEYTPATIVSSVRESDSKIVLTTQDDETYTLTLLPTGEWRIKYDDESITLQFKAYAFEYYGVFKGTYTLEDIDCDISLKVENNKSVVVNDDGNITNYTITEYDDASIAMENDDGDTLKLTLQTSGSNQGKWKMKVEGGYVYLTFVSFANNPLEGVTFKGTCGDDEEHQIVFKSGMKADYIIDGTIAHADMEVDISNYPTSVTFTFDNDGEEESRTATFTSESKFKLNMGDCGSVIYSKQ